MTILKALAVIAALTLATLAPARAQPATAIQPDWQQRDPAGGSNRMAVAFADDKNGWTVGIDTIVHTTNGGQDWGRQWSGQPAYWFNSVAALSPRVALTSGFAYGRQGDGIVLRTEDGGENWKPVKVGSPGTQFHSLVFRRDRKTGYLVSTLDGLLKTLDGGLTWNPVATPRPVNIAFIATRGNISLPDDRTIYLGADRNVLLRSADDAATWDVIDMPQEALSRESRFLWIRFADAQRGWVQPMHSAVFETRDGAKTWQKSAAPGPVEFFDAKNGWSAGATTMARTTDGGLTWMPFTDLETPNNTYFQNLTSTSKRVYVVGGNEGMGLAFIADRLLPGVVETTGPALHAPIPIRFNLAEAGVVTLVIGDATGRRVRNLISETSFPAGQNVVYWDGLDESGRINEAPNGIYDVQGKLVPAGKYYVRGIVRKPLDLRYEFTLYNAGQIPWPTADKSSEWLTNHTPPAAVVFLPPGKAPNRPAAASPSGQILVGSKVAEGGSGLAWIDAASGRKLHGQMWVGGTWTGAAHLARDIGENPVPGVYAYTGSGWESELRIHELLSPDANGNLASGEDRRLLTPNFAYPKPLVEGQHGLGGLAVRNGLLVASLPILNQLLFIDARAKKVLGTFDLQDPRGVAYDAYGNLFVLAGSRLLRYAVPAELAPVDGKITLPAAQTFVATGLDNPQGLALDSTGNIYISNHGALHQVKVFSPEGKFLRAIGKAGVPKAGLYDEQRMHNPAGLTIARTPEGERLWVAEENYRPKRLSLWKTDGTFVRAFYGPTIYGGGGGFDPADKTRFFHDGIEFQVDWKTGEDKPSGVYYLPAPGELKLPDRMFGKVPETPIRSGGKLYLTDAYTGHPTNGIEAAGIYLMQGGVAKLVAAAGLANVWDVLKTDAFKASLPVGADLSKPGDQPGATAFVWSDLNEDGQAQPAEVQFRLGWKWGGTTVMPDLSFTLPDSTHLAPTGVSPNGVPRYDFAKAAPRFAWTVTPSSGSGQILDFPDAYSVATSGPIQAFRNTPPSAGAKAEMMTAASWTYPNQWPGLHASHYARTAKAPGEILGGTRLLGLPFTLRSADPADKTPFNVWGLNGNMGNGYLMTSDGLFVGTIGRDHRQAKPWPDKAVRNMPVNNITLGGESFYNTISQTADGKVYVQNSNHIIRVDGLDSLRRIPAQAVSVTPQLLKAAQDYFVASDAARQAGRGTGTLNVAVRAAAPVVDGKLDDWTGASWVPLDAKTNASALVSGDTLYLAYKTGYRDLLKNTPEAMPLLFKTGGALDFFIGADPKADSARTAPAIGDQRLLISRVGEKTVAMRYRAVVNGPKDPVPFASPTRTVTFDRVDNVSDGVKLAQGTAPIEEFRAGNVFGSRLDKYQGEAYEVAIPLSLLDLKVEDGTALRGDLGVLIGNGFQTIQRIYWNNKASGLVSDIPGEAMLTPQLWGKLNFKAVP